MVFKTAFQNISKTFEVFAELKRIRQLHNDFTIHLHNLGCRDSNPDPQLGGVTVKRGFGIGIGVSLFFLKNAVLGLGLGLWLTLTLTLKKHSLKKR